MPAPRYIPPLWPATGNDATRPLPITLPGSGTLPSFRPELFPGVTARADNTQRVINPDFYQNWQFLTGNLASGLNVVLLQDPPNTRVYMNIRVSAASIGSLAVGLNQVPAGESTANWLVGPGQSLEFPIKVPQNRIFGLAVGGAVDYVITWAVLGVGT